jgi:hypothetical protein
MTAQTIINAENRLVSFIHKAIDIFIHSSVVTSSSQYEKRDKEK